MFMFPKSQKQITKSTPVAESAQLTAISDILLTFFVAIITGEINFANFFHL